MAKEYSAIIFYHFAIRFIFKMSGSLIWPIKHHQSDFFQRLMELPENVPRCWLLEISSSNFLPMRITAGFPIMLWQGASFFYSHYKQGIYPSDWQDLQRGTSFHLFLRMGHSSIQPVCVSSSVLLNPSRGQVSVILS